MSREPLRHCIRHWISRKPLEIDPLFQRTMTINGKWPMGNRMLQWPMTPRDPERSKSWPNTLRTEPNSSKTAEDRDSVPKDHQ